MPPRTPADRHDPPRGDTAESDDAADRSGATDDRTRERRPDRPPVRADGGRARGRGDRPDVLSEEALVESYPGYEGQLRHARSLPPESARTRPPESVLDGRLADRVGTDLYGHQAEALDHLADGENVVVTTSTSSGKTWVYALQVARNALRDGDATALCLYPTKALTRDQEAELNDRLREWGVDATVGVYDGDTPRDRKRRIRREADVILTNFAGLNVYLPRHDRDRGWHRFYTDLELVVVDEAHEYSGVTGTHIAWILRRLRRVLDSVGADPAFVVTTATIGNPAEHARNLTGEPFRVVDDDGSPRGRRDVVLWEPPLDDEQLGDGAGGADGHDDHDGHDGDGHDDHDSHDGDGSRPAEANGAVGADAGDADADPVADFEAARVSTGAEASAVTAHLGLHGVQTLQFCQARQGAEIAARQAVDAVRDHPVSGYLDVEPYHAGLGKRSRRAVENRLKSGDLDAVASTNALELGIDVGSVDATVAAGYPGTRQSFWQQVGRAGRGTSDALSVLVGGADAMDAYVLDNPEYLFEDDVEDAVVTVDNDHVYADHVLAAAAEAPLRRADADVLGGEDRLESTVEMWQDAGLLSPTGDLDGRGVPYTGDPRPASRISLYATAGRQYRVVCTDDGHEIDHDDVAEERAYREYHEGALFLHGGTQYRVEDVDHDAAHPRIFVTRVNGGRYTTTLSEKTVSGLTVEDHRSLAGDYDLYFGRGDVRVHYDQYLVRDIADGGVVEGPLPTGSPPTTLRTDLLWVSLPADHVERTLSALSVPPLEPSSRSGRDGRVPDGKARYTYAGGIHAAEHGVIQLAPLELMIDDSDVGGLSTLAHPHPTVPGPVWFVHDGIDGGVGFARAIYEQFETILERTRERVGDCRCGRRRGCPLCVMSEHCGNDNDPLDTATADLILGDVSEAF